MTKAPKDTLLAAAQKVAQAAGLPWSHVQPIYRALQQPGGELGEAWLPKSAGRAVWMAHPNFITRLLIGIAGGGSADQAHQAIEWAINTTQDGRRFRLEEEPAANVIPPIEEEFFPYLVHHDQASDLQNVEFREDENRIVFNTKSRGTITFSKQFANREGAEKVSAPLRGIYTRGVIDGRVFVLIANIVNWRRDYESPVDFHAPQEPGE